MSSDFETITRNTINVTFSSYVYQTNFNFSGRYKIQNKSHKSEIKSNIINTLRFKLSFPL